MLPNIDDWRNKILFLETSEEILTPECLKNYLLEFDKRGIFNLIKGLIIGKPFDNIFYEEYKSVYKDFFVNRDTPIMYNVNFGHCVPRCILKYDSLVTIDCNQKKLLINYK